MPARAVATLPVKGMSVKGPDQQYAAKLDGYAGPLPFDWKRAGGGPYSPVATGRLGSVIHSLQEPAYSGASG